MTLTGQAAVVTGASRGLGRAIARRLAQEGAAVCVNYRTRTAEAEATVEEIRAAGGRAIAVRADISDLGDVRRMIETAAQLGAVS